MAQRAAHHYHLATWFTTWLQGVEVTFVRSTSLAYLSSTTDEFDFAFVDGDHSGRTVYRDIAALERAHGARWHYHLCTITIRPLPHTRQLH